MRRKDKDKKQENTWCYSSKQEGRRQDNQQASSKKEPKQPGSKDKKGTRRSEFPVQEMDITNWFSENLH